jgi:hypothetical protein
LTNLNKRIAKEMRVLPIHEASHFEELVPMLST